MLQNAEPGTAKAEFPLAESSILESPEPEPEIEVESPQCVEEGVSETPLTEAVAGAPYVSLMPRLSQQPSSPSTPLLHLTRLPSLMHMQPLRYASHLQHW